MSEGCGSGSGGDSSSSYQTTTMIRTTQENVVINVGGCSSHDDDGGVNHQPIIQGVVDNNNNINNKIVEMIVIDDDDSSVEEEDDNDHNVENGTTTADHHHKNNCIRQEEEMIFILSDTDDDDHNSDEPSIPTTTSSSTTKQDDTCPTTSSVSVVQHFLSTLLPHEIVALQTIQEVLDIKQQHDVSSSSSKVYMEQLLKLYRTLQKCNWNMEETIHQYLLTSVPICSSSGGGDVNHQNDSTTSSSVRNQHHHHRLLDVDVNNDSSKGSYVCVVASPSNELNRNKKSCQLVGDPNKNRIKTSKRSLFPSDQSIIIKEEENGKENNNTKTISTTITISSTVSDSRTFHNNILKPDHNNQLVHTNESIQSTPSSYYIDHDFPPNDSSLDGRKRSSGFISTIEMGMDDMNHNVPTTTTEAKTKTTTNMMMNMIVQCKCHLPAAPKRVQSDGPNYGKFYLSCGLRISQQGKTKRRAPVVLIRDTTTANSSSRSDNTSINQIDHNKKQETNNLVCTTSNQQNSFVMIMKNPYAKQQQQHPQKVIEIQKTTSKVVEVLVPKSPPQQRKQPCNFFQWDHDGSKGVAITRYLTLRKNHGNNEKDNQMSGGYSNSRKRKINWYHFGIENDCCLYRNNICVSHIKQGSIGNCWFLSALAVVAEKKWLIEKIITVHELNTMGRYVIHLCLDGKWVPITIDSYLPVIYETNADEMNDKTKSSSPSSSKKSPSSSPSREESLKRNKKRRRFDFKNVCNGVRVIQSTPSFECYDKTMNKVDERKLREVTTECCVGDPYVVAYPAFCATPKRQIWPALIEKAYAKVHGSYTQLCAGFIAEGLQDLTGAPTQTYVFTTPFFDPNKFWLELLSYYQAGYIMGVATSIGGDGLVGSHAYSVLEVLEINDAVIGEQAKVTDYFHKNGLDKEQQQTSDMTTTQSISQSQSEFFTSNNSKNVTTIPTTNVRLVRIRNPWGIREWKGEWSSTSDRWTKSLRMKIGMDQSYAINDGTFYMSYEDMLTRFHHMDICKTREGWIHESFDGVFEEAIDPTRSSKYVYKLKVTQSVRVFFAIILPKKRSNVQSNYWYCDPSFLIFRKNAASDDTKTISTDEWSCCGSIFSGTKRDNHLEMMLEPTYEYLFVPFSFLVVRQRNGSFPFRFTTYSSDNIIVEPLTNTSYFGTILTTSIHKKLLSYEPILWYHVAHQCQLVCVPCNGCLYFLALNGNPDHFLSIKLSVEEQDGLLIAFGRFTDTYDVAPRNQKLLAVITRNGKQLATATDLIFRYVTSVVTTTTTHGMDDTSMKKMNSSRFVVEKKICHPIELTLAGELMTNNIHQPIEMMGTHSIDIYSWIPQLGSSYG